jgi:diaminobutyrate-2-oxoglutarate transaminase
MAAAVCRRAFERGMLLETSGPQSEVVKLMPPLTIGMDELDTGLELLTEVVDEVVERATSKGVDA